MNSNELDHAPGNPTRHARDNGATPDTLPSHPVSAGLLYGVPAIAAFLDMEEPQARHLCDNGTVPTFKIGRIVCARRSTIVAWLEEREAAGRVPTKRKDVGRQQQANAC